MPPCHPACHHFTLPLQGADGEVLRGLGEIRTGGRATGPFCSAALACLAAVEPQLVGMDPRNVELIVGQLLRSPPPPGAIPPGAGRPTAIWHVAISALESALWDIAGKLASLPIYGLLGGSGSLGSDADGASLADYSLRTYANINRIARDDAGRTPEKFASYALSAQRAGWDAFSEPLFSPPPPAPRPPAPYHLPS